MTSDTSGADEVWHGFVDDAATVPPEDAPLPEALARYVARPASEARHVGSFVSRDTDLPALRGFDGPVAVVVTGGAGQLAGPAGLGERLGLRIARLDVALRDLDDLAGNARRVTAVAAGLDVPVHVELPVVDPTASWLAAADEIASAELRLSFRTGGLDADLVPTSSDLAACIDAALDRETTFTCTGGLRRAVRHRADDGPARHGFLNIAAATGRAFDGAGREEVVTTLDDTGLRVDDETRAVFATGRRWFTSFDCGDVDEPIADLRALGLLA